MLNSGGRIIQNYVSQGLEVTPDIEFELLIKAVRVNTLSKLTFTDTNKFLALIGDVFPGVKSADIAGGELEAAIKEVPAHSKTCSLKSSHLPFTATPHF